MKYKLNLGCGHTRLPDHVNVDKFGSPDMLCDLEVFPWPWATDSVDEILLSHVLEHLGATSDVFIGIMKEMYRVCENGARISINVPHPRHDHFIGDPTHVRPITLGVLQLFSRQLCLQWQQMGAANSPLALYHGVDFEVISCQYVLDPRYQKEYENGNLTEQDLDLLLHSHNNVASEIKIQLRAIKTQGAAA